LNLTTMPDDIHEDLRVFSLQSQLRQAKGDLRRVERELLKSRLEQHLQSKKMRTILLRAFRVVTCSRAFVDANAFGEGNSDLAWLCLYEAICDFDEEVRKRMNEEEEEEIDDL
jgi:hypothetical protein